MKQKRIKVYMTTEKLNGYRLTSLEEPTDEMLEAIMKEACEEAKRTNREADERRREHLKLLMAESRRMWQERINRVHQI